MKPVRVRMPIVVCVVFSMLGDFVVSAAPPLVVAADRSAWARERARILAGMQEAMGPLPDKSRKVPLDVRMMGETKTAKYVRKKLTYAAEKNDRVPAFLLIPLERKGKLPAVLCLHQTNGKLGKEEPAGLSGKPNLHYAHHLAERGYVTLAPDYPSFGEYPYDFRTSPFVSGSMKAVWNNMRAIDLLEGLPEVDAERIGCIGHSLGGHNTMFTAAFDTRIKAFVSNCGFTSFSKYYGGKLAGWTSDRYMPLLRTRYNLDPARVPFDFPGIVASFAPRAFLASAPVEDDNFEVSGVKECIAAARPIYDLFGAGDKLAANYPACQHDFPPEVRQVAYDWLDRWLKAEKVGVQRQPFEVRETAGIRRFSYPVHAEIKLGRPLSDRDRFRLLEGHKPIPAQFQPAGTTAVSLDFPTDHGPYEKRSYTIEYGSNVADGPTLPESPMVLTDKETFTIAYPRGLQYVVPRDGSGLLHSVNWNKIAYLRAGSPGLWIADTDHRRCRIGAAQPRGTSSVSRVVRQGPYAVGLRWESMETLRGGGSVQSLLELTFPRTKSWIEATWTVNDPAGKVGGLGAELVLDVQQEPILVDFGAGSFVYAALRKGQAAKMEAVASTTSRAGSWSTWLGPANALRPYVVSVPGDPHPAEGWAHLMDRTRCTAVAVDGFSQMGQTNEVLMDAKGRLRIARFFSAAGASPRPGPKQLRFWLHFVTMPVHVGAATSPQAMLHPLEVLASRAP